MEQFKPQPQRISFQKKSAVFTPPAEVPVKRDVIEEVRERRLQREREREIEKNGGKPLPVPVQKPVVMVPVAAENFKCVSCKKVTPESERVFKKMKSSPPTKEDWCWGCIKEEDKKNPPLPGKFPKYFLDHSEWKANGF